MSKKFNTADPWFPVVPDNAIIHAIKAVARGDANEHQQKLAMEWVIGVLCDTHGMSFRPDSIRGSDFAEGKRFVGLRLIHLIKRKMNTTGSEEHARSNEYPSSGNSI